jgi:hypothetical protein
MSCSISKNIVSQHIIDRDHVIELYNYLYDDVENGGAFNVCNITKKTRNVTKSNTGEKDSVEAPDAIVNWHTHPVSCYIGEKTVWGWPSGEDMRETLIFGMRGSACHVVPSVEGVYIIQPNPCIVSSLLNINADRKKYPKISTEIPEENWGDFLRGLVIVALEIYFRSTHVFRTLDYANEFPVSAQDFVDFTNAFELDNIFKEETIPGCSGNMRCDQIHRYDDGKKSLTSFGDYIKTYETDAKLYYVTKKGDASITKYNISDFIDIGICEILKDLVLGSDCNFPIEEWQNGKMFTLELVRNKVLVDNSNYVYYDKLSVEQKNEFLHKYSSTDENPIILGPGILGFNLFEMNGNCNHSSLQKHIRNHSDRGKIRGKGRGKRKSRGKRKTRGKRKSRGRSRRNSFGIEDKLEIVGSPACRFCNEAKERAEKKGTNVDVHYFGTIQEAIQEASKKAGTKVNGIPAYFKNGVYSEAPLF